MDVCPTLLFVQVQTAIEEGQTGHQEYGQTKDGKCQNMDGERQGRHQTCGQGHKDDCHCENGTENSAQKFIGNLFLHHGKEMDIKNGQETFKNQIAN